MKITEVRILPANENFVAAYASICLDDCFLVHDIRIIVGAAGLFISFPNVTQSDGTQRDIAFPVNAETRRMIEQVVLAEYEKGHLPKPTAVPASRPAAELKRQPLVGLQSLPGHSDAMNRLGFELWREGRLPRWRGAMAGEG